MRPSSSVTETVPAWPKPLRPCRHFGTLLSALAGLWLGGCTTEATPDPIGPACASYAAKVCAAQQTCAPFSFSSSWATLTDCTSRKSAACKARATAPDTGLTAGDIDACAATIAQLDCSVMSIADTRPACLPKAGKRAIAAACGDDSQCQSTYCRPVGGGPCGTCAPRAAEGMPCNTSADCQADMACVATASVKKCASRALVGDKCDATHVCISPAVCQGGKCQGPVAAGASCDTGSKNCDAGKGLYCHEKKLVCSAYKVVATGAACGYFDGDFVRCDAASTCHLESGGQGTCVGVPKAGESCSTGELVPCVAGLVCDAGKCGTPNPASCN